MKTNLFFLYVGLISSSVFVACNKEEVSPRSNSINLKESSDQSIPEKSLNDFSNPYEFAGEIHNLALSELKAQSNYQNLTTDQKFNLIAQTVRAELGIQGIETTSPIPVLSDEIRNELDHMRPNEELWQELLSGLSKSQKQIMQNFEREIETFNIHQQYGLTIANMKRLEAQSFNNPHFNDEDRLIVLGMLSIGRYSFAYWHEQDILNGDHLFTSNGVWKADISGFRKGWKFARDRGYNLGDAWDYAEDIASANSEAASEH